MGCACGTSGSPNPAHALLMAAFDRKESVNMEGLQAAVNALDATSLNSRDAMFHWSALDITALMEKTSNRAQAADVLLAAGADPFGSSSEVDPFSNSSELSQTAFGKCIKYNNADVMEKIVQKLDAGGWEKFIQMLTESEVCDCYSRVPGNCWVLVDGKKGKTQETILWAAAGADITGGQETVRDIEVHFEDGTTAKFKSEKMTILPQVPLQILQVVYKTATEKGCTEEQLERIKCVEESDRNEKKPKYDLLIIPIPHL